jgi:transglutaminase/protease-like cytokinesis protein 3
MYIYDIISLNYSYNKKQFRKICRERQNTFCVSFLFRDDVKKYGTAREPTSKNIIRRRQNAICMLGN